MIPPSELSVEAPQPAPPGDLRTQSDRRRQPTDPRGCLPPAGHRMKQRRADEHCRPYLVDRFPAVLLTFVVMLLVASIVDALLTVRLIDAGGSEINPLMDRLLSLGLLPFLLGKYVLTAAGLPLLVIFKNYYLFRTRFRVGYLFPVLLALYALLIGYQLVLIERL